MALRKYWMTTSKICLVLACFRQCSMRCCAWTKRRRHVADAHSAMLEKLRSGNPNDASRHSNNLSTLLGVLKPLAPRLGPNQAAHIADILASIAAKPPMMMPSGMAEGFAALEPVLEDADLKRIADALVANLPAPLAVEALTGVAKRMQSAQAASAGECVLKLVSNPHPPNSMSGLPDPCGCAEGTRASVGTATGRVRGRHPNSDVVEINRYERDRSGESD